MAESEITTDVVSCYLTECENNDALSCGLVRISIGTDGVCLAFKPIEEAEKETN